MPAIFQTCPQLVSNHEKKSILILCCPAFSEVQMTHLNPLRILSGSADGSSCRCLPRCGGEGNLSCDPTSPMETQIRADSRDNISHISHLALKLSHFIADGWRSALRQVRLHRQQVHQDSSAKLENTTSVFCQVGVGGWFCCFWTFLNAFETFVFLLA